MKAITSPHIGTENPQTWNEVEKTMYDAWVEMQNSIQSGPSLFRRSYNKLVERGLVADQSEMIMGFDHVAVLVWDIELWTKRYRALGAGDPIYDNPDMSPDSPSSAKLRGIKWGNLLIALLEPINREEESQVYRALCKHGDHFFQHIAIRVKNLEQCKQAMQDSGANFTGEILQRADAFGPVRQIFGRIFDKNLEADEGNFWEFVERPRDNAGDSDSKAAHHDFDDTAARKLYKSVEESAASGQHIQFIE